MMTPDEFVELFADTVYRSAIRDVGTILRDPPGRTPASDLVETSRWYRGLTADDRSAADNVIAFAAHATAFGALALLDGVRSSGPVHYELVAVDANGDRVVLSPSDAFLHDRFQGLVTGPGGTFRE